MKAFIGQGNGSGAKAQAAAAAAQAAASGKELQGDRDWDDEEEPMAAPKQRLKGQTQKEQKVRRCCDREGKGWRGAEEGGTG